MMNLELSGLPKRPALSFCVAQWYISRPENETSESIPDSFICLILVRSG